MQLVTHSEHGRRIEELRRTATKKHSFPLLWAFIISSNSTAGRSLFSLTPLYCPTL